jgi:hypothetical protein
MPDTIEHGGNVEARIARHHEQAARVLVHIVRDVKHPPFDRH